MFRDVDQIRRPDPFYSGAAGFVGATLEKLHQDMSALELPPDVPDSVRRSHDSVRNAYLYSYYSYDLLTIAAAQTFPCLELALRVRIGDQFKGRVDRKERPRPPAMLPELLDAASEQGLVSGDLTWVNPMRKTFAHGSDAVLNPPLFLAPFQAVTEIIAGLFGAKPRGPSV